MTNPPYSYRQINVASGMTSPSTVHVRNTALHSFFERYLLQKAMSVFRWKMPLNWAKNYFLYGLFYWGYVGIVPVGVHRRKSYPAGNFKAVHDRR